MKEWIQAEVGNVVTLQDGEDLTGIFKGLEESASYKDSWAFHVQVNDEIKTLFGNKILKDLFEKNDIKINQEVRILYTGKKKNEKGTFEYKTYELFYKK